MQNLNHAQLEVGELYRFIQLESGEFEFSLVTPFSDSHRLMADGRKCIGAGYFGLCKDKLRMDGADSYGSMTLGIQSDEKCLQALETLLGKKISR